MAWVLNSHSAIVHVFTRVLFGIRPLPFSLGSRVPNEIDRLLLYTGNIFEGDLLIPWGSTPIISLPGWDMKVVDSSLLLVKVRGAWCKKTLGLSSLKWEAL